MRRARILEGYPGSSEDFQWWYFGTESSAECGVLVILVNVKDGRMKAVPVHQVKIEITGDLWPD